MKKFLLLNPEKASEKEVKNYFVRESVRAGKFVMFQDTEDNRVGMLQPSM